MQRVKGFIHQVTTRKYLLWALLFVALVVGLFMLVRSWQLAGPSEFSMATGRQGGAYFKFTEAYAASLAEGGVTLDLVETAGSVETLDKLLAREVPVGLVQSGVVGDKDVTGLYSLGSVFYEPILIFYRRDRFETPLDDLLGLDGRRVAVGEVGSGTRMLALQMLADNGLDENSVDMRSLSARAAAEQLIDGSIDAAFFVLSLDADLAVALISHPDLDLVSLRRAGAYEAHYPYLTQFTIHEGTVDLPRNIPGEDKVVLATTAMLAANELLHVDSARQLLTTAQKIHGGGDLLAAEGTFPSAKNSELPVPQQVRQFLELGPSDLEKYLPVSIADIVQRILFVVLPIFVLLYPLLRSSPGAYSFANRYRIYRWYQQLRRFEIGLESYTLAELEAKLQTLKALEVRLTERLNTPMFYQRDFYNLRLHLRLVIDRYEARRQVLMAEQPAVDAQDNGPTKAKPDHSAGGHQDRNEEDHGQRPSLSLAVIDPDTEQTANHHPAVDSIDESAVPSSTGDEKPCQP